MCGVTFTTHLGKASPAFGFIAHKGTLARMQAPMIVKICDLSEGLATIDALIRPIVCMDAFVVPQIGRLREAYKEKELLELKCNKKCAIRIPMAHTSARNILVYSHLIFHNNNP